MLPTVYENTCCSFSFSSFGLRLTFTSLVSGCDRGSTATKLDELDARHAVRFHLAFDLINFLFDFSESLLLSTRKVNRMEL